MRVVLVASAAILVAVSLAGCSGGDEAAPTDTAAASTAASAEPSTAASEQANPVDPATASASASPQVSIDPSAAAQMNVTEGSAPIPGAVDSTKVTSLSKKCEEAVQPVRDIMAKYKSGLLVTDDADNQALTEGINNAAAVCEAEDPQQWADFYSKEYFGWLNAATE